MSEVDEIEAVLIVKPGETLVVKAGRDVLPEHVEELARLMESRVTDGVRVLVLAGDIDSILAVAGREADRIADAVRKATENPGHAVSVDDPWKGFPLQGDEVQR